MEIGKLEWAQPGSTVVIAYRRPGRTRYFTGTVTRKTKARIYVHRADIDKELGFFRPKWSYFLQQIGQGSGQLSVHLISADAPEYLDSIKSKEN